MMQTQVFFTKLFFVRNVVLSLSLMLPVIELKYILNLCLRSILRTIDTCSERQSVKRYPRGGLP